MDPRVQDIAGRCLMLGVLLMRQLKISFRYIQREITLQINTQISLILREANLQVTEKSLSLAIQKKT